MRACTGRASRTGCSRSADRDLGDLLAEELRRLDADEAYAEALSHWTGVQGLAHARATASTSGGTLRATARERSAVMGAPPEVVVHRDEALLAQAVAARLVTRLVDAQAAKGAASLVLTGGGIGIATLVALRESPAQDAIDWARLDIWWGDERFVPHGYPDRNETQAREALLDHVPVDPGRVFPMSPSDGPDGDDPEAAAQRYADLLAARAAPEDRHPPEGHGPVPAVRRADARDGSGRTHRVDVPRVTGSAGHAAGGGGPRLPEAPADANFPHPAYDLCRNRSLDARLGRVESRGRAPGPVGRRARPDTRGRGVRSGSHPVAAGRGSREPVAGRAEPDRLTVR